jgi:hypothetical protein
MKVHRFSSTIQVNLNPRPKEINTSLCNSLSEKHNEKDIAPIGICKKHENVKTRHFKPFTVSL